LSHQTLLPERNRSKEAAKAEVELVQQVELLIEHADAAIAHQFAVSINSHNARFAALSTVLGAGRLDSPTRLTIGELADIGDLLPVFLQDLVLD